MTRVMRPSGPPAAPRSVDVARPVDLADALRGDSVPAGTSLRLSSWDVRVLATVR
jgi:hypothetical protein